MMYNLYNMLILLSITCVNACFASNQLSDTQPRLTVVTEEYKPFNYVEPNGRIAGISTEIIRQLMDTANIAYDIEIYSWSRAYQAALKKKNVMI